VKGEELRERVPRMREMKNAYRHFVGVDEGKTPFGDRK
jgi:hypothetical protein